MAISTKRRKPEQVDDDNIFAAPVAQTFEDVDGEDDQRQQDDSTDIQKQMEEMEKRLEAMQTALDRANNTNLALLSNPLGASTDQGERFVEEKIEIPDPTVDPDGFVRATERKAQQAAAKKNFDDEQARRRANDINEKVKGLWEDFADTYPDHADQQDRVEFAAEQVIRRAKRRGIDPQKYMFVTSEKFMADVAAQMEKTFGPVGDDGDYEDEEDTTDRRSRDSARSNRRVSSRSDRPQRKSARSSNSGDDFDAGRTGGIFGGLESGGRPAARGRAEDEGSMLDDIQKMQRKTGFF